MECVVRGYLYGSSWREYRDGGGPTTEHLPTGLVLADRLPEPIFTPATKATTGHDENITESETRNLLGDDLYEELRKRSVDIYLRAAEHAADERRHPRRHQVRVRLRTATNCSSSTRCSPPTPPAIGPPTQWVPGQDVPSFDKQYVREWLDTTEWDHTPPPPDLPDEVVGGNPDPVHRGLRADHRLELRRIHGRADEGHRRRSRGGPKSPTHRAPRSNGRSTNWATMR